MLQQKFKGLATFYNFLLSNLMRMCELWPMFPVLADCCVAHMV